LYKIPVTYVEKSLVLCVSYLGFIRSHRSAVKAVKVAKTGINSAQGS